MLETMGIRLVDLWETIEPGSFAAGGSQTVESVLVDDMILLQLLQDISDSSFCLCCWITYKAFVGWWLKHCLDLLMVVILAHDHSSIPLICIEYDNVFLLLQ